MTEQTFVSDPRRTRVRRRQLKVDKQEIVDRVLTFHERDIEAQREGRDARIQREAKLRMWREGKDWPWEGASDVAIPDMAEKSLRAQDTLHNAVMSQRPVINARAVKRADRDKEEIIDNLIDYQVFEEQPGETIVGDLSQAFIDDGVFTVFIPWVREKREILITETFEEIPPDIDPPLYFQTIIEDLFPNTIEAEAKGEGWDWTITTSEFGEEGDERKLDLSFYTRKSDNRVEVVRNEMAVVYDGPCLIPKDFEEVLHPPRAANLQRPGPSNPRGASHVILVDHPTVDEIRRLAKQGFYEVDKKDLDSLGNWADTDQDREREKFRDDAQGSQEPPRPEDASHRTLTRLMCFDVKDVNGDGLAEDVIWWVLLEPKLFLRGKRLTDIFPFNPPRRPLAEATYIPVRGRRIGVSLPELVEGLHDAAKSIFDLGIDAGTLQNTPWGFYRPSGSIQPEAIRLAPGELYPSDDPANDLHIPQFGNQAVGFAANFLTLLADMEDRVTMIGDLAFGQIPGGQASAFRSASAISQVTSQQEARPERILRRFFIGIKQIWEIVHQLNSHFLPKDKQFRVTGIKQPGEDPYQTITDRFAVRGDMRFTFAANIFNTSKQLRQQGLQSVLPLAASPLAFQAGIVQPDGLFRLYKDVWDAFGLDADRHLTPPVAGIGGPRLLAEEAIDMILEGQMPSGQPAEQGGWIEHAQKLQSFAESDELGVMTEQQVDILLRPYLQLVAQRAEAQMQQEQAIQEAAGQQQFPGQGQPGRPATQQPNLSRPQVSGGNELLNERLPSAGGGGNQ